MNWAKRYLNKMYLATLENWELCWIDLKRTVSIEDISEYQEFRSSYLEPGVIRVRVNALSQLTLKNPEETIVVRDSIKDLANRMNK